MIQELETLAKLPPSVRADIERYCALRGFAFADVLKAAQGDHVLDGMIRHLAAKGHSLRHIHEAAGVSQAYAHQIIKDYRADQVRVRTTDWGRFATCRR